EIGPAILLPTGKVIAFGATGYNAFFDPSTSSWSPAPTFPKVTVDEPTASGPLVTLRLGMKDAPACLLTNGNVLCATGPVDGVNGNYDGPVFWKEFNGTGFSKVASPPTANTYYAPYQYNLLMLPNGQVLATNGSEAFLFDSTQKYPNAWRP